MFRSLAAEDKASVRDLGILPSDTSAFSFRLLRFFLLLSLVLLVNRVLLRRTLHLYCDVHTGLGHIVILTKSLEARGQHLDPNLSVRNKFVVGFSLGIRLQLNSTALLFAVIIYRVHHHSCISYRPAIFIPNHQKIDVCHRVAVLGERWHRR